MSRAMLSLPCSPACRRVSSRALSCRDGRPLRIRNYWARRSGPLLRRTARVSKRLGSTLPKTAFDVKRQLIFSGHGFVITPLETGVRVGGAVELGGIERPPNYARSKALLDKAQKFLPGLDPAGGREWM